jgi:NAD(P)-dependent dehydrogenase (short-subunit alcohol dehydrogenase family)
MGTPTSRSSASNAPDLTGKTIVVTGANAGIGLATATDLAAMGATVVMTARDRGKGEAARKEVVRRTGNDQVVVGDLDLASLASVREFAAWFLDEHERIDVLVNNAGLIVDERRETADGFEMMFGVNHLGHFLLTDLLRDRLVASAPARVVVLSSVAHRWAPKGLDRSDLQSTRGFKGAPAYGRSKLANVLFARELARQLVGSGVTVNAVHPGSVNTHFGTDGDTGAMAWWITTFGRYVLRTPEQGARTSVLLASSEDLEVAGTTGGYWSHGRRWRPSKAARDSAAARWLWEESERLVGGPS